MEYCSNTGGVSYSSHAQILAALKAWCHWLAQLHTEDTMKPLYDHLVLDMVNSAVPLLATRDEPTKLYHSAAHLLVTLTGTVRPAQIWELQPIRDMYHMPTSFTYLSPEVFKQYFMTQFCFNYTSYLNIRIRYNTH